MSQNERPSDGAVALSAGVAAIGLLILYPVVGFRIAAGIFFLLLSVVVFLL